MPGPPRGRRHTDPPPFIPDLDQIYRSNAPGDSAQDFPGPAPKKYYYDGSSSPDKNKDKEKETSRFRTFSRRKRAMDAEIEAEQQSMERATAKIAADYPVVAELVTSSTVSDKYTIHNLAHVLSNLYNRPQSAITISQFYTHNLLHDHTRDPSYILTITVPPALSEGYANDVNAVALAQFLDEALAVPPRRGTIKFMPIHLGSLAVGGRTLLGLFVEQIQADRAARDMLGVGVAEERGRRRRRSISSLRGLGLGRSRSRPIEPIFETAQDEGEQADDEGKDEDSGEADDGSGSGSGKTGKGKRSLRSIFGRGGSS